MLGSQKKKKKTDTCSLVSILYSGQLSWLPHSFDGASFVICSPVLLRRNTQVWGCTLTSAPSHRCVLMGIWRARNLYGSLAAKVQTVCLWVVGPKESPFRSIVCHLRELNGWYLGKPKGLTNFTVNLVHVTLYLLFALRYFPALGVNPEPHTC
jgi:hypothetical protein